jgi:predicted RNA-binding Zn-ribbon protein involved in translation (DUF1610 family)
MKTIMNWLGSSWPFVILVVTGFFVLVFSVWGLVFDKPWTDRILAAYALLIILSVIFILATLIKSKGKADTIEEFEKTLKGKLYHFKCPGCNGIFAIKKSKSNDKKPVKMTCPDCGAMGIISPNPTCTEEDIPEKKSLKANFKCKRCREGLTIWAEGTDLYEELHIYSCPYCGEKDTMARF